MEDGAMSETETEIQPTGEPEGEQPEVDEPGNHPDLDAEPAVEIEGDEEAESGEPDADEGDEAQRQHENEARAQSEEALEKLHRQIENANKAHAAKLERIMGADFQALIPCPVCMDFTAGMIFPPEVAPIPETVKDRMKQLLGLDAWEDTPGAPWAQQCPDCKGHGQVKTGSFVNGKEVTTCQTCKGDGWRNTAPQENGSAHVLQIPAETGPSVYGHEVSNDPEIDNLRKRGFTVIPPMNVAQG
jgi:rubrerythrin